MYKNDLETQQCIAEMAKDSGMESVDGVFFGAGCTRPYIVPVRITPGPDELSTPRLAITEWVPLSFSGRYLINKDRLRFRIYKTPKDDPIASDHDLYLFFESQRSRKMTHVNDYIISLASGVKIAPWYGNVLVVKCQGPKDRHSPTSMTPDEIELAKRCVLNLFHVGSRLSSDDAYI